jgi:prevent-host-death family protein
MNIWQMQEAKARLSEVVRLCEDGPQIISLHGVEKAVIMDIKDYRKLLNEGTNIVSFFQNSPLNGLDLDIKRDKSPMRDVEL